MTTINKRTSSDRSPMLTAGAEWRILAILAIAVFAIGMTLPRGPDRVDVTIDNPTDYRLYIEASSPGDTASTHVVVVGPQTIVTTRDVIDRGAEWVLDIRSSGSAAGTLHVDREALVDGTFVVPSWVGDDLHDADVPSEVESPATGSG